MKVTVLAVRTNPTGVRIAYVQAGKLYGEVRAQSDVCVPGVYKLRSELVVDNGRLSCKLKVCNE